MNEKSIWTICVLPCLILPLRPTSPVSNRKNEKRWPDIFQNISNSITQEASFATSRKWSSEYPQCNYSKNKYLSPIVIDTSEVIRDKNTSTLFVYSSSPNYGTHDYANNFNYYKLSFALETSIGYNMSAVNLQMNPGSEHDATYIAGLGDTSYRFFVFALILYSKSNKGQPGDPELSLHRIDQKTFPMEIVMYFSQYRSRETDDDTTQIHVMVDVRNVTDNPLIEPLVQAMKKLRHKFVNRERNAKEIEELTIRHEELELSRKEIVEKHDEQGVRQELNDLHQVLEEVKGIEDNIKQGHRGLRDLQERDQELDEEVFAIKKSIEDAVEKLAILYKEIEKYNERINQKLEEGHAKELADSHSFEAIEKMNDVVSKLESDLEDTRNLLEKKETSKRELQVEISSQSAEINALQLQLPIKFKHRKLPYKESAEASLRMKELKQMLEEEDRLTANARNHWEWIQNRTLEAKLIVDVKHFQVSWLLPGVGGHYMYNGSSPVPPCKRRAITIVMEKSIIISESQLAILTSAGNIQGLESLKESLPPLSLQGERWVRYNKKNLQYILDDAVHMKSKLRKKLKAAARRNVAAIHFPEKSQKAILSGITILSSLSALTMNI